MRPLRGEAYIRSSTIPLYRSGGILFLPTLELPSRIAVGFFSSGGCIHCCATKCYFLQSKRGIAPEEIRHVTAPEEASRSYPTVSASLCGQRQCAVVSQWRDSPSPLNTRDHPENVSGSPADNLSKLLSEFLRAFTRNYWLREGCSALTSARGETVCVNATNFRHQFCRLSPRIAGSARRIFRCNLPRGFLF